MYQLVKFLAAYWSATNHQTQSQSATYTFGLVRQQKKAPDLPAPFI